MKAIKRPVAIDVVVFDPAHYVPSLANTPPIVRAKIGGGSEVWNARHASWIGVEPGDYLNVSDPQDIYPIAKAVFDSTYDLVAEPDAHGAVKGTRVEEKEPAS